MAVLHAAVVMPCMHSCMQVAMGMQATNCHVLGFCGCVRLLLHGRLLYLQASAGAAELAAAQARASAQLEVLESQLASKDSALQATEVRLAALEAEIRGANSKVRDKQTDLLSCGRSVMLPCRVVAGRLNLD